MIKNFLKILFIFLLISAGYTASADPADIHLTVADSGALVFSGSLALPPAGTVDITDSSGNSHSVDAHSVLSIVSQADTSSSDFGISSLIYYSSFSAFYLKCVNISGAGDRCDNWQYKINGADPGVGMDQAILSGGENVSLYFGSEYVTASSGVVASGPLVEPGTVPVAPETPPTAEISAPSSLNQESEPALNTSEAPKPSTFLTVSIVEPQVSPVTSITLDTSTSVSVTPETKKVPEKKIIKSLPPKNKITKVSDLAAGNLAAPITAIGGSEVVAEPVKKENWFWQLLKDVFGF